MLEISEIIIVEGKNDANKVLSCVKADVLITSGTHFSKDFLKHLKILSATRGIIVMTDDDYPGRYIRDAIDQVIDGVKHAYVFNRDSRKNKKIGVEHASKAAILKALENLTSYQAQKDSLSLEEFYDLGLQGKSDSRQLRHQLCQALSLPVMNAKRLFKALNQLGYTRKEIASYVDNSQ